MAGERLVRARGSLRLLGLSRPRIANSNASRAPAGANDTGST